MAVFTFSTRDKQRPGDTDLVERVKKHCEKHNLNFSAVVVKLLREYDKELVDVERR